MLKIISWNLNGLKSSIKKGFYSAIDSMKPDIICCQESRSVRMKLDLQGYSCFWNVSEKPSYAGLLVASSVKPLSVTYGVGSKECDHEGRCTALEFNDFYLVNVYVPNCRNNNLERYYFRQTFDEALYLHLQDLGQYKPVILCGDFNVAHKFLDLNAESLSTVENPVGFLTDDRDSFERILELGYIDAFRFLYPNKREYTWVCNYKSKEQEISIGTRIDYFLVSNLLTDKIKDVTIHQDVECSDHRPTELLIDIDL